VRVPPVARAQAAGGCGSLAHALLTVTAGAGDGGGSGAARYLLCCHS